MDGQNALRVQKGGLRDDETDNVGPCGAELWHITVANDADGGHILLPRQGKPAIHPGKTHKMAPNKHSQPVQLRTIQVE